MPCSVVLFAALPAAALEADQVRGEIVSVSPAQEQLRLRVQAAGDERQAAPGDVVEYRLPQDVEVHAQDRFDTMLPLTTLTRDDLQDGDQVILDFENVKGQMVARNVTKSTGGAGSEETAGNGSEEAAGAAGGPQNPELAQQDQTTGSRSSLPETASALPLFSLLGLGFMFAALGIRRRRNG